MNAPDPANEPQTLVEKAVDLLARQHQTQGPMNGPDEYLAKKIIQAFIDQQPDVFARLTAWLAEDNKRSIGIGSELGVMYVRCRSDKRECYGLEYLPEDLKQTSAIGLAKAPGLAATIEAALEKAEKVKL